MHPLTIALFGESNAGDFHKGYLCKNIVQLCECLGEPPHESAQGIPLAIQALMFNYTVLFFRVKEEGFSRSDYFHGLKMLQKKEGLPKLGAVCLPGVGDSEIIQACDPICHIHKSLLFLTDRDLYDYLMY
jgi:hypothetical protein